MRIKTKCLLIVFLAFGIQVSAQQKMPDKWEHYSKALRAPSGNKDSIIRAVFAEAYHTEADFVEALRVVRGIDDPTSAVEKLYQEAAKKFPNGLLAREWFLKQKLYKEAELVNKERAYRKLLKKWPPKKFASEDEIYDRALHHLAINYATFGNKEKALFYLQPIGMPNRINTSNELAHIFLEHRDTLEAKKMLITLFENAAPIVDSSIYSNKAATSIQFAYISAVLSYVKLLLDENKNGPALDLMERSLPFFNRNGMFAPLLEGQISLFEEYYFKALIGEGRLLEAYNIVGDRYKAGAFHFEDDFKLLYGRLNGSLRGYEAYVSPFQDKFIKHIQEEVATCAVYEPAPSFDLFNLKGEKVSLAGLKGKVVVLDFWATWCGPCVASFPGMKAAQDLYQKDKNVVFLFITSERKGDYKRTVTEFIQKRQLPFNVLFDDKIDSTTGKLIIQNYGVKGIPTKIVIDGDGNMRYRKTGGGDINPTRIKLEMREMIEAAKKPYRMPKH